MSRGLLFEIGGEVYRIIKPFLQKQAKDSGAKQVTKQQADKINKNPSTITNKNQLMPTYRTKGGRKIFRPLDARANAQQGRKFGEGKAQPSSATSGGPKLSKPTQGTGRATVKAERPSVKAERPSVKAERPSLKKQRPNLKSSPKVAGTKPKASPSRPTRPAESKTSTPVGGARMKPSTPLKRAAIAGNRILQNPKVRNSILGGAALVGAASLGNKGQKKSSASTNTVTGPKPRPQVQGPPKAKAKPQGDARYRPGKGGQVMPKKFDGGYNSKTQRLINITIDGKKSTYEIPKGMTTKQATNLLKGTVKKKAGGTPGKYKGFSKLPEKVQKKMSPKLAAKYEVGGGIKSIKEKLKPKTMPKVKPPKKYKPKTAPMPKIKPEIKRPDYRSKPKPMPKMYKEGGSVGSSKVARQVKGFGAARKPKK